MTAAKRTPGDWEVFSDGVTIRADNGDGTCTVIADTKPPFRYGVGQVKAYYEQMANAHMLAAGPKLADALDHPLLRELLGALEDGAGGADNARLWALAHSWMDTRDAALAATRGES